MKMSAARYGELRDGIRTVVDHHGREKVVGGAKGKSLLWMMWGLLHALTFDLMYDDTHPAFQKGRVRINPHKPGWTMYVDGLNDTHYETALKKIAAELGLAPEAA